MNQLALTEEPHLPGVVHKSTNTFVTMNVGGQAFGIPIELTRDILVPDRIFRIPLARNEVAGSVNLRGRIVTVIDMHARLGLARPDETAKTGRRCVTVEHRGELYSLLIDSIGDILDLPDSQFESLPSTIKQSWKDISKGVYRLNGKILVILDIKNFLDI